MSDRQTVAKELAQRDGADWDSLSKVMVNAYLHNADLVIQERNPVTVNPGTGKPEYTCLYCKDTAFIESKPCWDCNPRGLPAEQVHPKDETVDQTPKERELKPGEYSCSKCSTIHRANSKLGKKHLQYGGTL